MTAGTDSNSVPSGRGLLGSKYARNKRALMATINEIRATGAAVDVDLPTIVVAGNQSSGKSSLIEAISGINLPRAAGTCTRVPIEVRLRQDDSDWTCLVKVRREGSDQDDTDGRKPEVSFGNPITDRSLVEATIRRAQIAILNPSVNLDRFVTYDLPLEEEERPLGSSQQFAFSNDVIVLEITGPDETDLTLVDLPGIIQNVGQNEDKNNIVLVEGMVKNYISKDCLILLVITMKDDIQNQKAALLAREVDPEGKRTIGVLTKVDTLQSKADIALWLKVVQGLREPLTRGYYVTRQPDADALAEGITFAQARADEEGFFGATSPWKGLERHLKKRLGTKHLTAYLSDQLSSFITAKLPELEKQITARYKELDFNLKQLGKEPPEDATGTILTLLNAFQVTIDKHIQGEADHEAFMQDFNELAGDFANKIRSTKPTFVSTERGGEADKHAAMLRSVMDDPDLQMYLDDMRLQINGCKTRELPNELLPAAQRKLIKRCTSNWEDIAVDLLDAVKPGLQALLESIVDDLFGKYAYGGLRGLVGAIMQDQLQSLSGNALNQIKKLVMMERLPFTLNAHYLDATYEKSLASLKKLRTTNIQDQSGSNRQQYVTTALSNLATLGYTGLKEDDLPKLLPADNYETELKLMASTCAYWKVAFKRVIDNIPHIIDLELLQPLAEAVRNALMLELRVAGDVGQARCKEFIEEAPMVAEQRKDLSVRRDRLGDAKVAIRKFKMK